MSVKQIQGEWRGNGCYSTQTLGIRYILFRRIFFLLFLAFTPGLSVAYDAQSFVHSSKGDLPLVLTVPHDGGEVVGLLPVRKKEVIERDLGTKELAENVASILEARTGKRPYLVVARFSRKYLDANRPIADAMESKDALPAYMAYHNQISTYISEIKSRFPSRSLLLDFHGQAHDPNTTFRGTRSGLTAKVLLDRFGSASLQDEKSITGLLEAKGYQVNPVAGAKDLREYPRYSVGYTVFKYGSHHREGIDAIQLEFGRNQRESERFPEDLADALIVFMRQYELLPKPLQP